MPVKQFKPTSAGSRFKTVQSFDDVTTSTPYKPLVEPLPVEEPAAETPAAQPLAG